MKFNPKHKKIVSTITGDMIKLPFLCFRPVFGFSWFVSCNKIGGSKKAETILQILFHKLCVLRET